MILMRKIDSAEKTLCASMKKNLQKNTYNQLIKDITELYDYALRAIGLTQE